MTPLRRITGLLLLAALAASSLLSGSCAKNDVLGQGLDRYILVRDASPVGPNPFAAVPDSAYKWPVNSIDSVIFNNDIDSVTLEVTAFELVDSTGRIVPGIARFMPGNAYIHYTEDFPSNAYAFTVKNPPLGRTMSKVYFIPSQPLHPHRTYSYVLTSGVRMLSGRFVRDIRTFSFTTGDSLAPPNPIWPERPGDIH